MPCLIHAQLYLVKYRSKSGSIALVWFGNWSLWFTLFYCKVLSSHELGSCAEGHHKSNYHSTNLRWHDAMSQPSHANQPCMPIQNQTCHLHIYLIDSQCCSRGQLAISFMTRYPSHSANFHVTHTSHDLHHLPCVRKLVSVVSCECEWAILQFAGMIDYEIWASTLCKIGLYQINVIVIFWQGFTACLAANDHFSSNSFARPTAKHICLRYFISTNWSTPTLCDVTHLSHLLFDMLPGGNIISHLGCTTWWDTKCSDSRHLPLRQKVSKDIHFSLFEFCHGSQV